MPNTKNQETQTLRTSLTLKTKKSKEAKNWNKEWKTVFCMIKMFWMVHRTELLLT